MRLVLIIGLLLSSYGCVSSTPVSAKTPAAPQSIDLTFAKNLLEAQTAIEAAKGLVVQFPGIKDPLNKIIATYNTVQDAYLVFHKAYVTGTIPNSGQLQLDIQNLVLSAQGLVATYKGKP